MFGFVVGCTEEFELVGSNLVALLTASTESALSEAGNSSFYIKGISQSTAGNYACLDVTVQAFLHS